MSSDILDHTPNPTRIHSAPLVGAHFHPPAKLLIAQLRSGTELRLVREPQNQYDENAIGVWIDMPSIGQSLELDEAQLAGYGFTADEIATASWQLGHIAAKTGEARAIAPLMDAGEIPLARLAFNMNGQPIVRLAWGSA